MELGGDSEPISTSGASKTLMLEVEGEYVMEKADDDDDDEGIPGEEVIEGE
jgi:hypothetical protein